MTGNYLPWLVLLGVVVVSLVLKGYVKLPSFSRLGQPSQLPAPAVAITNKPPGVCDLESYDARTLAYYLALASRREAERAVASQIAEQAAETIKATFTAPFSPPAPAGQTPPASVQP